MIKMAPKYFIRPLYFRTALDLSATTQNVKGGKTYFGYVFLQSSGLRIMSRESKACERVKSGFPYRAEWHIVL